MSVPGPVLGPCESWISGADVAACCGVEYGSGNEALDVAAVEASMALFEISGRRFTGGCLRTVRPCRDACGCWGSRSGGPWHWTSAGGAAWGWHDDCGDTCGCGHLSTVKLAGYPVTEIISVTIDGVEVDPATYRLDGWTDLVRLEGKWPACQDLTAGDDAEGSFVVTYRWGVAPPPLGLTAAQVLACQIYKACAPGGGEACELPTNATKVVRQGITVERGVLLSWLDPKKSTGLVQLDVFLRGYARKGRRPAVWSPDVQPYARRVGT